MRQAHIVVDLGYGDQGKGATVDYLARRTNAHTIVRFNGGGQAAHHVTTDDGRWHKFSHFGSGMFQDGVSTFLSRFMFISPKAMIKEADFLEKIGVKSTMARTFVDLDAVIIAPYHQAANRIVELQRGQDAHGSCGIGFGKAVHDSIVNPQFTIKAGDLHYPDLVRQKLQLIKEHTWAELKSLFDGEELHPDAAAEFQSCFVDDGVDDFFLDIYSKFAGSTHIVPRTFWADLLKKDGSIVFEGAQGVLLDEWHGFHPHTTWSTTTFENADILLEEGRFGGRIIKTGVTRAYSTRHGAGPFVVEDPDMTRKLPEHHNSTNRWQDDFRVGWLDLVALKYASRVAGQMDHIAVTCLDRIHALGEIQTCTGYHIAGGSEYDIPIGTKDMLKREEITDTLYEVRPIMEDVSSVGALLAIIGRTCGATPGILSYGQSPKDKVLVADDLLTLATS
jgi:adenylosuccinate synthase